MSSLLGDSRSIEVPDFVHHELEVIVTVDAHGNLVVVHDPLLGGDHAGGLGSTFVGVAVKSVEEVEEDLILRLITLLNLGMFLGVVGVSDVIDIDHTVSVLVHNGEGFHGEVLTVFVHLSDDGVEVLFVINRAILILIHGREEGVSIDLVEVDLKISNDIDEFSLVDSAGPILVSNSERATDVVNATSTSGSESSSHVLEELFFSLARFLFIRVFIYSSGLSRGTADSVDLRRILPCLVARKRDVILASIIPWRFMAKNV